MVIEMTHRPINRGRTGVKGRKSSCSSLALSSQKVKDFVIPAPHWGGRLLSILLIQTTGLEMATTASAQNASLGHRASAASTSKITPSASSIRARPDRQSLCPGVSMTLILTPCTER